MTRKAKPNKILSRYITEKLVSRPTVSKKSAAECHWMNVRSFAKCVFGSTLIGAALSAVGALEGEVFAAQQGKQLAKKEKPSSPLRF